MGTGTVYTKAKDDSNLGAIQASAVPGAVLLDSFAGADDDAKLTAALSYAAAQTYIPAIMFPARNVNLNTNGRTPFSGMKLIGPVGAKGQKNLELSSGKYSNHRVLLHPGTGTNAWFYGTATYYDIFVGDLAFQAATGGQFWHQPSATLYACRFDSLTMYGFTSCFGHASAACLITAVNFTGSWEVLGWSAAVPQFHFGGSDSALWMEGQINLQSGGGAGNGTPAMWLESLQKTSLGYVYITCQNDFGGLRVSGSSDISMFGGTYEGMNAGAPSTRAVLDVQAGIVKAFGTDFNFVTTANGAITQSGGQLDLHSPTYWRACAVADTYPLLYQTGGKATVLCPNCRQSGEDVRVRWSDTSVQQMTRATQNYML